MVLHTVFIHSRESQDNPVEGFGLKSCLKKWFILCDATNESYEVLIYSII